MSLQFITGCPGTGKTTRCLEMIKEKLDLLPAPAALYYLIPEQFSLQAEKLLLSLDKRTITGVQAISFNRLAYRLFAQLGGPPGKLLDDVGKGLLLRKTLFECAEGLRFYTNGVDKQGFIDNLSQMVTELNRHRVTAEDLRLRMPESSPTLQAKLYDLALILESYRISVQERYLLTDDMLDVLCQRLEKENPLAGSFFWVDGFNGFTPQECRVLSHILQAAEKTVITLTFDAGMKSMQPEGSMLAEGKYTKRENDMFSQPAKETMETLTRLAHQAGTVIAPCINLQTAYRHSKSPALAHFVQYFQPLHPIKHIYETPQNTITITHAPDKYACVYEAARQVWALLNEKQYRFRDIAILCGDQAAYTTLLQTTFSRCRIPLFVDTVTDILSHPLTELVRASLEIVTKDWPYTGVFRFLKTGLAGLTIDEVDILENYVLARGIKSYRWRYPFSEETAEATRLKVLEALQDFDKHKKTDSVEGFSRRLFKMLSRLQVPEQLTRLSAEHLKAGDPGMAKLHGQVWDKVCEVVDKLVEILGDTDLTLKAYAQIIDAGLSQADLGRIPPTVDQVFLGDISRSRFPEIKAMLVLGANENALPPLPRGEGLLTDHEQMLLRNTNLELASNNAKQRDEDMYALYCALCQPTQDLHFIYATGEMGGNKPLRPAPILKRIKEMFPTLKEETAPDFSEYEIRTMQPPPINLSPEAAKRLYGPTVVTAASRLEKYASCPFAYFVTYNLKARERKIYQVQHADLGVLFHEVLAKFSQELAKNHTQWGSLTYDEIASKARSLVEQTLSEDGHILKSTARNRHIAEKAKRICTTSLWALCEHVKRGSFTPAGSELAFSTDSPLTSLEVRLNDTRRLLITGRIDRVDIYHAPDGCHYVKIIDYKSQKKKFDLSEVLLGTQLQLILYINALIKNAALLFGETHIEARPGGVFYFHIGDPILPIDEPLEESEKEERLLKCFRMSGLALAEEPNLIGMDEGLKNGGDSLIIPVTINKNGVLGKASSVRDLEGFEQLGKGVEEKIKELGLRMTEGCIEANPLVKGQKSACDYCRYGGICGVE